MKKILFSCLLLASVSLWAQNTGNHKYITYQKDSCRAVSMDVLEIDNRYYLLTDLVIIDSFRERIPTVTIFDESLNIVKKIELFGGSVKIMPLKYFYLNNVFYLFGLTMDDNQKAKPFFAKFDKDFNLLQPITLYALDNPLEYGYTFAMVNKKNEFLYLVWDNSSPRENRLLHIDTNGIVLHDLSLLQSYHKGSIAETDNYYFIDYGRDYLLRLSKEPLELMDTLYITLHERDVPEGSLIAINNQLIRTHTYYSPSDSGECGLESPFYEKERSIEFLDTNMNTNARLVFGEPCANDDGAYLLSISYINPDSIYYAYETVMFESEIYRGNTISVANFSQDGQLNFSYMLSILEDTLPKYIYGCQATSDGGVLVYWESRNFLEKYSSYGFILKYHPQRNDLIVKTFPLKTEIKVFPNPAHLQFTVTNTGNANIYLYNILGQEVKQVAGKEENTTIYTDNLPAGMYILKVLKGSILSTHKIQITE